MTTNSMRAFISIAPDPRFVPALASIQAKLSASSVGNQIRWTKPDQIHLTLCFLGNISTDQSGLVIRRMSTACDPFTPFSLRISGIGCFPNLKRPRVLWIGLRGAVETLLALQSSIRCALSSVGLHQEPKPFHPHLTLGRMRPGTHRLDLEHLLDSTPPDLPPWQVKTILLMRSELNATGPRHSLIYSHDLVATTASSGAPLSAETPPCPTRLPSVSPGIDTIDSSTPGQ